MERSQFPDSQLEFTAVLEAARKVVVLTGAGISAESGIPTFRGAGGLWRRFDATIVCITLSQKVGRVCLKELATPRAFAKNPSRVWEFYHYRRCIVAGAVPNAGHYALEALQHWCERQGKLFTLLTQNIDGLHPKAGSTDVVELHGSLWRTRCCQCNHIEVNLDMPICPALQDQGAPEPMAKEANIPSMQLPRCKVCNGLLRPHVVWFGECLEEEILEQAHDALNDCDLLLVIGTSAVVQDYHTLDWGQPAAGFAPLVKAHGGIVAEFNMEDTPISYNCRFKFRGPAAATLPTALGIIHADENQGP